MPHHTTTIAILAAVLVVLFVYQYVGTPSADLDTYIPFSSSAKFGTPVEGLTSNIQDAEDLDWDDLPEAGGDLLMGEGEQAVSSGERKVRIDLGVMSRCPDAVRGHLSSTLVIPTNDVLFVDSETLRSGHG